MSKMTAKEMFEVLGYEQTINSDNLIEYKDDSYGYGDYKYVVFHHFWKEYLVGYYDGYETKTRPRSKVSIEEHEAITKQMKELGWI